MKWAHNLRSSPYRSMLLLFSFSFMPALCLSLSHQDGSLKGTAFVCRKETAGGLHKTASIWFPIVSSAVRNMELVCQFLLQGRSSLGLPQDDPLFRMWLLYFISSWLKFLELMCDSRFVLLHGLFSPELASSIRKHVSRMCIRSSKNLTLLEKWQFLVRE